MYCAISREIDYATLDTPSLLQFVFYPRPGNAPAPDGAQDYALPVDNGVSLSCRFYRHRPDSPSLLYFHGNGEVASDYDEIAPLYREKGLNLFVVDYRGYGRSGGMPTIRSLLADAHPVFRAFQEIRRKEGDTGGLFVMGRSLGSAPAIELAASYPDEIKGLIIESGFASLAIVLSHLGYPAGLPAAIGPGFPNRDAARRVSLPVLILHGEQDSLVPISEARDLFQNIAGEKSLVIIGGAEHNDIMWRNPARYFGAVSDFVARLEAKR
ncbi:MAG: alpha/beta hydrolase [Chloroflexota bacterium]